MREGLRRALAIILAVGSLLFVYTTVRHVWDTRFIAPFYDEWDFIEWYQQVRANGLSWSALWMAHNGHHLPLPRLVYLMRDALAAGDPGVLVVANLLLQGATLAALARVALREPAFAGTSLRWVLMASTIVLLSWTVQIENFHWSIQFIYVMATAQAVASLYCLVRSGERPLLLGAAVVLAATDTLTLGAGLAVWPSLLVAALALRLRGLPVAIILGGGVGVAVLYLAFPTEVTGGIGASLGRPLDVLHYMARYLGPPFASDTLRLVLGGALITAAAGTILYTVVRGTLSRFVGLHLGLVTFGLSVALLTALARLPMGIGEAGSSRYAAFSTLFWVGLVSLAAHGVVMRRLQTVRWTLYGALAALFVFLVAASQNVAPRQFLARTDAATAAALSLAVEAPDVDAIRHDLYPRPEVPLRVISFARQEGYGLFGSKLVRAIGGDAATVLPGTKGECNAPVQVEPLEAGSKISGILTERGAPLWLVVVGSNGKVQGLGVRRRTDGHFTAYARQPEAGATLYGVQKDRLCRVAGL